MLFRELGFELPPFAASLLCDDLNLSMIRLLSPSHRESMLLVRDVLHLLRRSDQLVTLYL